MLPSKWPLVTEGDERERERVVCMGKTVEKHRGQHTSYNVKECKAQCQRYYDMLCTLACLTSSSDSST